MIVTPRGVAALLGAVAPLLIMRFRRGTASTTGPTDSQLAAARAEAEDRLRAEIAAHERTAAALYDSEERFAGAFDAAPIGMLLIHVSGSPATVWTNRAFRAMLGYEDEGLIDPPADRFIFPDD